MENGKIETAEERYIRRHKRYLKAREEGKPYAFHQKPKSGKWEYTKVSDMSEEKAQKYREMRHRSYLKSRELNMPYVNTRKKKEISEEEREKRRLRSAQYRIDHPFKNRDDMRRWRALHGEEERRSWQEYRRKNKQLCIEYLGGKCLKCNGVFHPDVYDFHHKDENEKDICIARLLTRKFEKIIPELDKCILVCANCHRTIHAQY